MHIYQIGYVAHAKWGLAPPVSCRFFVISHPCTRLISCTLHGVQECVVVEEQRLSYAVGVLVLRTDYRVYRVDCIRYSFYYRCGCFCSNWSTLVLIYRICGTEGVLCTALRQQQLWWMWLWYSSAAREKRKTDTCILGEHSRAEQLVRAEDSE